MSNAHLAVLLAASAALAAAGIAFADEGPKRDAADAARQDFVEVARVLSSPRCKNCHPAGDAPLHGDAGAVHGMNVSRKSAEAGLKCIACHREQNGGRTGSPPGVF